MRARIGLCCLCTVVAVGSLVDVSAQAGPPAALAARVQTLEDRDAIRALLVAYATTLDNRDFAAISCEACSARTARRHPAAISTS
jgi:hypothetical protein